MDQNFKENENFDDITNQYIKYEEQLLILENQIRELYGRVVYSHKIHMKCADNSEYYHNLLKTLQIIISAVLTTSLLIKIWNNNSYSTYIAALLSAIAFALNVYSKDYDLGEISQKHINTANEIWDIRECYLSLINDINIKILSVDEIIAKRDDLQAKLKSIYDGAPRTNSKAYKQSQKALKQDEELTFSDKEIDNFLPSELRKTKEK